MRIDIKEAAEFLRENNNYLILMHASPDGDTLGCGTALCGALQRLGKNARAVCPDEIPHKFDYLFDACENQDFEPETVVCVDVADSKLLGDMKEIGDKAKLCIDHHVSNVDYAEKTLLDPGSAAACEIICEVIKELGISFDAALANSIYTGTATDTGCFKFSNTTPKTHRIAAEMIEYGADFVNINYVMFDLKTPGRLELEQQAMKTIRYYANGHIAVIFAPFSMISNIDGIDSDDIGLLASMPRKIQGVDIGICVKEKKKDEFKVSIRSSEKIDCAEIAQQFGGGGHERASGCSFYGTTIDYAAAKVVEASEEALRKAGII
ncbi:MAG: bifunctional oligoribonuclease/PAP phosphatase NrnA [Oscillospiraceae bacterium]|nr:bifunctional oligoribonuclease/PAP phosphatase NrnA [Oscillospiraceae bacterium]